jgi:hypothetical protein
VKKYFWNTKHIFYIFILFKTLSNYFLDIFVFMFSSTDLQSFKFTCFLRSNKKEKLLQSEKNGLARILMQACMKGSVCEALLRKSSLLLRFFAKSNLKMSWLSSMNANLRPVFALSFIFTRTSKWTPPTTLFFAFKVTAWRIMKLTTCWY